MKSTEDRMHFRSPASALSVGVRGERGEKKNLLFRKPPSVRSARVWVVFFLFLFLFLKNWIDNNLGIVSQELREHMLKKLQLLPIMVKTTFVFICTISEAFKEGVFLVY